jgi:hypothetical protein
VCSRKRSATFVATLLGLRPDHRRLAALPRRIPRAGGDGRYTYLYSLGGRMRCIIGDDWRMVIHSSNSWTPRTGRGALLCSQPFRPSTIVRLRPHPLHPCGFRQSDSISSDDVCSSIQREAKSTRLKASSTRREAQCMMRETFRTSNPDTIWPV